MANIKDLLKINGYGVAHSILSKAGELGERDGIEVYAVGGFVRDLLMGRPINDIDIMTVGEGIPFAEKLAKKLGKNKVVSLISEAGTPLISDPGYKLIRRIRQSRHHIFSLPGPCSAIASLVISGLKTDKFCFLGFLPKNKNDYIGTIRDYTKLNYSLIIYEKPKRLKFFLEIIKENFKCFKLAIVKELSKLYDCLLYTSPSPRD